VASVVVWPWNVLRKQTVPAMETAWPWLAGVESAVGVRARGAAATIWVSTGDALGSSLAEPVGVAEMEWFPTPRVKVENVASDARSRSLTLEDACFKLGSIPCRR
jgi:hypothetical protein